MGQMGWLRGGREVRPGQWGLREPASFPQWAPSLLWGY